MENYTRYHRTNHQPRIVIHHKNRRRPLPWMEQGARRDRRQAWFECCPEREGRQEEIWQLTKRWAPIAFKNGENSPRRNRNH